jgi:hypothetical protein
MRDPISIIAVLIALTMPDLTPATDKPNVVIILCNDPTIETRSCLTCQARELA